MAKNFLQGALWTVPFVAVAILASKSEALIFLAMLLTLIAGVYLGFALIDGDKDRVAVEIAGIVVTCALAAAGLWVSPQFLAAGYAFHAGWDLLHHPGPIETHTPRWYAHSCSSFDLVVGAFILFWWR